MQVARDKRMRGRSKRIGARPGFHLGRASTAREDDLDLQAGKPAGERSPNASGRHLPGSTGSGARQASRATLHWFEQRTSERVGRRPRARVGPANRDQEAANRRRIPETGSRSRSEAEQIRPKWNALQPEVPCKWASKSQRRRGNS